MVCIYFNWFLLASISDTCSRPHTYLRIHWCIYTAIDSTSAFVHCFNCTHSFFEINPNIKMLITTHNAHIVHAKMYHRWKITHIFFRIVYISTDYLFACHFSVCLTWMKGRIVNDSKEKFSLASISMHKISDQTWKFDQKFNSTFDWFDLS